MQDSLLAEKVFDMGGYLATFRHRAKGGSLIREYKRTNVQD